MRFHPHLTPQNMSPKQALDVLIKGNQRFRENMGGQHTSFRMFSGESEGQSPFAAILSCSDSRAPTELLFDQSLGDIFSVRLAGNIASLKAIASIEYACQYLGAKLVVVLGHTRCGGVIGACDGVDAGNLAAIFSDIMPAVHAETHTPSCDRHSGNAEFIHNVIHLNVEQQMRNILSHSPMLSNMIAQEKIGLVGGIYHLENGMVNFYEEDRIFCADSQFMSIQKHISTT